MNYFGMTANIIDACMLICGKGGKILNARRNRMCFIVDLFCLTYWCYMDFNRGLYSQGVSCIVSMMIALYGFNKWGKLEKVKNEN